MYSRFLLLFALYSSPSWAENCSHIYHEQRPSLRDCAKRSGLADKHKVYYFRDHVAAGISPSSPCLESVEENSVRCYKWVLGDVCHPDPASRLFLRNRDAVTNKQELITSTTESVTFRSPNFFSKRKKRYSNSMLCVYNITVRGCNNEIVSIRSTSGNHHLFHDERDYLFFDFGDVTTTVKGDAVGSFSESITASSFNVVLWTDSTPGTDMGQFEIETSCKKNDYMYYSA